MAGEAYLPHHQVQVPIKVEAEVLQCVGLPILLALLLLLEQEDQQLVTNALNQPKWVVIAQELAAGGAQKGGLRRSVLGGCSQTMEAWDTKKHAPSSRGAQPEGPP